MCFFCFKQKTAYEMRISDWSSDVCSSDLSKRDDHPMAKLLRRPNPAMSGYDLQLWTSSTRDIYGDTFWYKQRTGRTVTAIYPLHPSSMSLEDGKWNFDNGSLRMNDIDPLDLVI